MKRLIFQVAVGKPSKLYDHCIKSVESYCERHGIDHIVITKPLLLIRHEKLSSGRSEK